MKKEIGKRIREERERQGLSLYNVGKMTGHMQQLIRNIENGETAYSIDTLVKTCEVLDLKLVVLQNSCKTDKEETDNLNIANI